MGKLKTTLESLPAFLKAYQKREYVGLLTQRTETLILVPTKSTAPVMYAFVENVSRTDAIKFGKLNGIEIIKVDYYCWSAEDNKSQAI